MFEIFFLSLYLLLKLLESQLFAFFILILVVLIIFFFLHDKLITRINTLLILLLYHFVPLFQSGVNWLIASKSSQSTNICTVIVFNSKKDPHALTWQLNIGKHHQEVDRIDWISEWQVVGYREHPSDVQEEVNHNKNKIGRPGESFVLSQKTVFLIKADETEISSNISI